MGEEVGPDERCVTSATTNRHVKSRRYPRFEAEGQPSVGGDGSAVSRADVAINTLPALRD
jgi:hypothetical protein